MYISNINNNNVSTGFKEAYCIKGAYINGAFVGQKHKNTVYNVAEAFAKKMHKNLLSEKVSSKDAEFFPDFRNHRTVTIARTPGAIYKQKINILTANDADAYKDIFMTSDSHEDQSEIALWTLKKIMRRTGCKQMVIHAEEKNGEITITDIERVFSNKK